LIIATNAPILTKYKEIKAGCGNRLAVRWYHVPVEADDVVMSIGILLWAIDKAFFHKFVMGMRDDCFDGAVSVLFLRFIAVGTLGTPEVGDELAPSRKVGFVPYGNIAVDEVIQLVSACTFR
jgi:hypothetical protein